MMLRLAEAPRQRLTAVRLTGALRLSHALCSQIYAPLNFFGSYYRQIQRNMIDMEP